MSAHAWPDCCKYVVLLMAAWLYPVDKASHLNTFTFIPQQQAEQGIDRVHSIHAVCTLIHKGMGTIDHYVPIAKEYRNQIVRLVEGIQSVPDDIIYVFVSGWAGWGGSVPYRYNGNAAYYAYLYQRAGIIPGTCVCYDHPNHTFGKATFGQKPDQENLYRVLQEVKELNPQASIILVGFSYGATTILNYLSQQPDERLNTIKAAVLESPFTCLETVLAHAMSRYVWKMSDSLSKLIAKMMPSYKPGKPTILTMAHNLPQGLPLCIGASKTDLVVDYNDTKKIVHKLKKEHTGPVYFFKDSGTCKHSYLSNNLEYAVAVNKFWRDSALPYNAALVT